MTVSLDRKKAFAFDWDGTLLDSMPVKVRTFSTVLAALAEPLLGRPRSELGPRFRARYEALSGAPRREIVEALLHEEGLDPKAFDYPAFSARLTEENQRELALVPLFLDGLDLLQALMNAGRAVFISSSVPQAELSALVAGRLPEPMKARLRGVFGSDGEFTKGREHVRRMLDETPCGRDELLFLGDDLADVDRANEAGVECILVDRRGRFHGLALQARRVPDFTPLLRELEEALGAASETQ